MDKRASEKPHLTKSECDALLNLHDKLLRHEQILKTLLARQESQSEFLQSISKCLEVNIPMHVWKPSAKNNVDTTIYKNIRLIDPVKVSSCDAASELRKASVRKFYVKHLKKITIFRRLAMWMWRKGYPIYVNYYLVLFSANRIKRCRSLISLSDFVTRKGILTCKLLDEAIIEAPLPDVSPISDQHYLNYSCAQYNFPRIVVATINSAIVYGGTNLTQVDGDVVCHDLYDFELDYTSEELHGRTSIVHQKHCIRWLMHDDVPESIPLAGSFVDACAINYAHWITEVLPRIVLFCADVRFDGIPIIINAGLHKNIMESLLLVTGAKREIILLPVGRALAVESLFLVSVTGYVPFDRRIKDVAGHAQGLFSPGAFEALRRHMNAFLHEYSADNWPEKIFLRRDTGTRKLINSVDIERFLVNLGYVIVEAEKLTFLQQIQLFNNARQIVAPTGAALANAVFCKPGAQVIVLMSKHENMIYRYWCNMLMPIQIKVAYVLGNILQNGDLGIHGDYSIDVNFLNSLLKSYEGEQT